MLTKIRVLEARGRSTGAAPAPASRERARRALENRGTHFTCVTSTKVQILTPEELFESEIRRAGAEYDRVEARVEDKQVVA